MFVILYGLTGEIGYSVRDYLVDNKYKKLKKYYYSSLEEDIERLEKDECDIVNDPQAIKKTCDYNYEINARVVGFNKTDFEKAANGAEDLFTTVSCTDIEFMKTLKDFYDSSIIRIYVYMDDVTLENAIKSKYKEKEHDSRIATGKALKHVYLENPTLFDNVILYGGEGSVFNTANLFRQLDAILERAKNAEIEKNSKRRVALPYVGRKNYAFVSYSHKDKSRVMDKLRVLQRMGFRLWYDDGLRAGENWRENLLEKIRESKLFIVFSSSNSTVSEGVTLEIHAAYTLKKKIVIVKMDESSFKGDLEFMLHDVHSVNANSESFEKEMMFSIAPSKCGRLSSIKPAR